MDYIDSLILNISFHHFVQLLNNQLKTRFGNCAGFSLCIFIPSLRNLNKHISTNKNINRSKNQNW